jgi:O-acetyl-ADP-ribose deacetylase (regulator of RNase III)
MIEFVKGDIFESGCQALVNPVNLQGIMGAGVAKAFKAKFPTNYKLYREACKGYPQLGTIYSTKELPWYEDKKHFTTGTLCCVRDVLTCRLFSTPVTIVNFPTKSAWKLPSEFTYLRDGLLTLRDLLNEGKIASIAIPALGCGKGGLPWDKVKQLITLMLQDVDNVTIKVYEPLEENT